MLEWPRTLRFRQTRKAVVSDEKPILAAARAATAKGKSQFVALVGAILTACRTKLEPKETVIKFDALAESIVKAESVEVARMVLALACVEVLRREPAVKTWSYLWSLAWHSAALERNLPEAVTMVAQEDTAFKSSFLEVASGVIKEAAENPGRRGLLRERGALPQLRNDWKKNPSLLKIWWGLHESGSIFFRDDDGVLRIVADLDLKAFIHLLTIFDNPYPIPAALEAARAGWSFERWKALVALAPVAFDEKRVWNGSAIVPLLLVIAREQLSQGQFGTGPNAPDGALKTMATEIDILAAEIAKAVAARPDSGGCAERWATWLMRQCLSGVANEVQPYPADARSRGYVDSVLIYALGREIPSSAWRSSPAADVEAWEYWCHRCVLVMLAASGVTAMPVADAYLDQWKLDPEDWASRRGYELKELASLFETFGKRPDAYGTRLLAIPLAEAREPQKIWQRLWDITLTLREIVEFGDRDDRQNDGWQGASAAARLMLLVFGLGLMMLDCVIDPNRKVQGDRQSLLDGLFAILADVVHEMAAIDRLNSAYWKEAIRHLAVRRAIWIGSSEDRPVSFQDRSRPSFADFLNEFSADTESLLVLLQMALRNGATKENVRQALKESDIDLSTHITFAERLIAIDKRHAGIGEEQLAVARSLI